MLKPIIVLAATLLASGCAPPEPPPTAREFVCYTNGALTERHVGVAYVTRNDGVFNLYYVDSVEWVTYTPRHGESCGLEALP